MKPAKDVLLDFLKELDGDFHPPLSEKTDLESFADKMLDNAVFFYELSDSGSIKGLIAMYANDYEKQYAYIPLLAVSPRYRKLGIANRLLSATLQYIASLKGKINTIGIHANNPVAISLYQKIGFKCKETINGRSYLEFKL